MKGKRHFLPRNAHGGNHPTHTGNPEKERERKMQLGWKHFKDEEDVYTLVQQAKGGGSRQKLKKNVEFMEYTADDISELQCNNNKLENNVDKLKKQLMYMENYSRGENLKFFGLPENIGTSLNSMNMEEGLPQNKDGNCKEIECKVMAAVKVEGTNMLEFPAVHYTGKQSDDGKPRAIIPCFGNHETRNELWKRRKELANSLNHQNVVVVPDYKYEIAKEQKKLSNVLPNTRKKNFTPAYIKLFYSRKFISSHRQPKRRLR
ncbi:hypothetical protein ACROYT_G015171 [Oculina patagonica]